MTYGTDEQQALAVEEIDPDYRDHFHEIGMAIEFYRNSGPYKEALARIVREDNE